MAAAGTVTRRWSSLHTGTGLGAAEVCALRRDQVDLGRGLLHVRRIKNGMPSVHPMGGIEIRALRRLMREQPESRHVFLTERRSPMTTAGFRKMMGWIGIEANFPFPVHPHMLRQARERRPRHPRSAALSRA
jgi:integrase